MVFCVLLECGMLVLIVWCGIYGGREIGGCLMIKNYSWRILYPNLLSCHFIGFHSLMFVGLQCYLISLILCTCNMF